MDYNYDNLLGQMELEVDQILTHFRQDEKQIMQSISRLKTPESRSTSTSTSTLDRRPTIQRRPSAAAPLKKITDTSPDVLVREIDKQLGGFYGSLELRDGLKEAQTKMNAVVTVLKRVREFVRSQFVRLQIEQLHDNINLLQKVFARMSERMELPDSDEFFNEALSDLGSSERTSKKLSSEPDTPKPPSK